VPISISSIAAVTHTVGAATGASGDSERPQHPIPNQHISDPGSFDTPTIDRLLETFFTVWHPRWPILHRPSFDWQSVPWDLVCVVLMTGAKLQSDESDVPGALQDEMNTEFKEQIDQMLEKGLSSSVAAEIDEPEFLQRMQTYVLYTLFVLYFGTDMDFAHVDRLVVSIVQLLHKSGVFHHPTLHEQHTHGSAARITHESWRMFVQPLPETLRTNTDARQGHSYDLPFRRLCFDIA
jgi:hypothetical protein